MDFTADCQRCSEAFDYQLGACPNCGWSRDEWAEGDRYGLGRSGIGRWD